jgi:hypothetical protein
MLDVIRQGIGSDNLKKIVLVQVILKTDLMALAVVH